MKQNKSQFVVDHFVEVNNKSALTIVMKFLAAQHTLFIVEPWPGENWRIYVRKDAETALQIIEDDLLT